MRTQTAIKKTRISRSGRAQQSLRTSESEISSSNVDSWQQLSWGGSYVGVYPSMDVADASMWGRFPPHHATWAHCQNTNTPENSSVTRCFGTQILRRIHRILKRINRVLGVPVDEYSKYLIWKLIRSWPGSNIEISFETDNLNNIVNYVIGTVLGSHILELIVSYVSAFIEVLNREPI